MNGAATRTAPLPRQMRSPSIGAFGGPGTQTNGAGNGDVRMMSPTSPTGKTLLEGYGDQILNGFQQEKPRYNPVSIHPHFEERKY